MGSSADRGQFPWLVAVNLPGVFCGGVLVSSTAVLTAAHCLLGLSDKQIRQGTLGIGVYDVQNLSCRDCEHRRVAEYIVHRDHADTTNDIAVLFLNYPSTIQPVVISNRTASKNEILYAVGWGSTASNNIASGWIPYYTALQVVDLSSEKYPYYDANTSIACKSYGNWEDLTASLCAGDSGGPLLVPGTNEVIGIASYVIMSSTNGTCGDHLYSIYMDLSRFHSWLLTNKVIPKLEDKQEEGTSEGAMASEDNLQSSNHTAVCEYWGIFEIRSFKCKGKLISAYEECNRGAVMLIGSENADSEGISSKWQLSAQEGVGASILSHRNCHKAILNTEEEIRLRKNSDYKYKIIPDSWDCSNVRLVAMDRTPAYLATTRDCKGFRWLKTDTSSHTKFILRTN